jgi:glycosyltransferase involved in cell wall biosynthesis
VLQNARFLYAISPASRRTIAEAAGLPLEAVSVLPIPVDVERFTPMPDDEWQAGQEQPTIAFVGRGSDPRKNLPLLLGAWARVASRQPDARLLIAGGGTLLESLRARADADGLHGSVRFTGYVAEAEKAAHFNLGDLFVFPSAMEGFGLAVAEAMASGLPVIASDRGSIPELIVDGEGGFLCDPADLDVFVDRLQHLLGDAPLRAKLGAANAERVERAFRWDRCVSDTRRVYEETLATYRARRR